MNNLHLPLSACFALVAASAIARAEIAPTEYEKLQKAAPEFLQIKVDEVSSKFPGLFDHSKKIETVKATVVKVVRSKSGVKKGDKITISYDRLIPEKGWAGPAPAPALEKEKEYPAYLVKEPEGNFGLAARGFSFETVKIK